MNERIKELKEQAMEWVPNQIDPDTKIRLLNAEKFAELIVKECAQVCRDQPNIYALKADRDNCAIAIEEHFGVER
jgi:hypothetical protein